MGPVAIVSEAEVSKQPRCDAVGVTQRQALVTCVTIPCKPQRRWAARQRAKGTRALQDEIGQAIAAENMMVGGDVVVDAAIVLACVVEAPDRGCIVVERLA